MLHIHKHETAGSKNIKKYFSQVNLLKGLTKLECPDTATAFDLISEAKIKPSK